MTSHACAMVSRGVSEHAGAGVGIESAYIGILDDKTEEQRALNCCRRRSRDKRKAIEGGAEGLLTKPIDFTLLKEEIDTRLERAS
jgi:hypothetical protein